MRFTSRKDRDRVWAEKGKIEKCKEFSSCFFVTDLPREVAQERAQLRRIAKRARDIHKIKADVKNNKLVLVESNLRYKLEEIPEYLKSGENKPSTGQSILSFSLLCRDLYFVRRLSIFSGFPFQCPDPKIGPELGLD